MKYIKKAWNYTAYYTVLVVHEIMQWVFNKSGKAAKYLKALRYSLAKRLGK